MEVTKIKSLIANKKYSKASSMSSNKAAVDQLKIRKLVLIFSMGESEPISHLYFTTNFNPKKNFRCDEVKDILTSGKNGLYSECSNTSIFFFLSPVTSHLVFSLNCLSFLKRIVKGEFASERANQQNSINSNFDDSSSAAKSFRFKLSFKEKKIIEYFEVLKKKKGAFKKIMKSINSLDFFRSPSKALSLPRELQKKSERQDYSDEENTAKVSNEQNEFLSSPPPVRYSQRPSKMVGKGRYSADWGDEDDDEIL